MSFHESDCCLAGCGARVCLTQKQYETAKRDGSTFYCSAGHAQHFAVAEVTKLQRRVAELEAQRDSLQRSYDEVRSTFWCSFRRCFCKFRSRRTLASHLVREHGARRETARSLREAEREATG